MTKKYVEKIEDLTYNRAVKNNLLSTDSHFGRTLTRLTNHIKKKKYQGLMTNKEYNAYKDLFMSKVFKKKLYYYIAIISKKLSGSYNRKVIGESMGSTIGGAIGSYLASCFANCLYAPLALISNCLVPATCICCWSILGKNAAVGFANDASSTANKFEAIYDATIEALIHKLDQVSSPTEFVQSIETFNIKHTIPGNTPADLNILLFTGTVTGCTNATLPFGMLGSGTTALFTTAAYRLCETHLKTDERQPHPTEELMPILRW